MPLDIARSKNNPGKAPQVPKKESFEKWIELGSLVRVAKYFEEKGLVDKYTGKPFKPYSFRYAAYTYLLENHKEAKPLVEKLGFVGDADDWNIYLIHRALTIFGYSKVRFMKWIKKNNFERYEAYYEKQIKERRIGDFWE